MTATTLPNAQPPTSTLALERLLLFGVSATGLAIVATILVWCLATTHGVFVYTMDDPYIHLALSEHIARGHYGINDGEYSSPASSILYPLLLTIGAGSRFHDLLPLALNVAATIVTFFSLTRLSALCGLLQNKRCVALTAALIIVASLMLNIFGVIFGGMEHSAHIALSLLILVGLIEVAELRPVAWWLTPAIVLTPLLRYEGLALAGAASFALWIMGHGWRAVAAFLLVAVAMLCFAIFLRGLGLPLLPSSVLVKSAVADAGATGDAAGVLHHLLGTARKSIVTEVAARWIALFGVAALVAPLVINLRLRRRSTRGEVAIALAVALTMLAHLCAGAYGWVGRYEIYALAVGLFSSAYLYRDLYRDAILALCTESASRAERQKGALLLIGYVIVLGWMGWRYLTVTLQTPGGSLNIYEQQYQMGEFAREIYARPVAVNDLGLVTFRNRHYVLDLYGLGSETARRARIAHGPHDVAWMQSLAADHDVGLAMIYDAWFPSIPTSWVLVARLHLGSPRITAASSTVSIYRLPDGDASMIKHALDQFGASLPEGVRLERTAY